MIDLRFIDSDGSPQTGKVPVRVRVFGSGDEMAARTACRQAFDTFMDEVRLGNLFQLQRTFIAPGICSALFTHRGGVTVVDLHLVGGKEKTSVTPLGFLVRLRKRASPTAVLSTAYLREAVAGGTAVVAGTLLTDSYSLVDGYTQAYVDLQFPLASIGPYAPKFKRAGTVSNLALISVENGQAKIRAVPENTTPIAGNLVSLNYEPGLPILSAKLEVLAAPTRSVISQFSLAGTSLALPSLTHTHTTGSNAPVRMVVLQPANLPAGGVVFVAVQATLYAFAVGRDVAWRTLSAGAAVTNAPQNLFGSSVTVANHAGSWELTVNGSNAAGICSSFSAQVNQSTGAITGAVFPMAIPAIVPTPTTPSGTWSISEVAGAVVSVTGTATYSLSPNTAAARAGLGVLFPSSGIDTSFATSSPYTDNGSTLAAREYTRSESSTATTYQDGSAKITSPLTGALHRFTPTVETTGSFTKTVVATAPTESGATGPFTYNFNYYDPFPTVAVGTVTSSFVDKRLTSTAVTNYSMSVTRKEDGVTTFTTSDVVSDTVNQAPGSTAPILSMSRNALAIANGYVWGITPNPDSVSTGTCTFTGRSAFNYVWRNHLITAADELAWSGFTEWAFDETMNVAPPAGESAWQGANSRSETRTAAWNGSLTLPGYGSLVTTFTGSTRAFTANEARFSWTVTPTSSVLSTRVRVGGTDIRSEVIPVTRASFTASQVHGFASRLRTNRRTSLLYTQSSDLVYRSSWGDALQFNTISDSAPTYTYSYTQAPYPATPLLQVTAPAYLASAQIGPLTGTLLQNNNHATLWEYQLADHSREAATDVIDSIAESLPPAGAILDVLLYDPRTRCHLVQRLSAREGSTSEAFEIFIRLADGTELSLKDKLKSWLQASTADPSSGSSLTALDDLPIVCVEPLYRGASLL